MSDRSNGWEAVAAQLIELRSPTIGVSTLHRWMLRWRLDCCSCFPSGGNAMWFAAWLTYSNPADASSSPHQSKAARGRTA